MDNNVHVQHTLRMIDALVRSGKSFELMIYPQVRHPIRVSRNRLHFHRLKTRFLLENLLGQGSGEPVPAVR
jgi:dipeptidyl-peptidase-4